MAGMVLPGMVLYCEALPCIEVWTDELQGAGLDIRVLDIHETAHTRWEEALMSVRGHLAPVRFWKVVEAPAGWVPTREWRGAGPRPLGVVLKRHSPSLPEWEEAAEWAAIGSLLRLGRTGLFGAEGQPLREPTPEVAYLRARRLMERLEPKPHPAREDPSLDYRTEWERRYDDG